MQERKLRNGDTSLRSKRSARNRGLRGTTTSAISPVKIIMRKGEVILPAHYNRIVSAGFRPESHVTASECSAPAGELAKTNPGAIERDPDAGELGNR